MHSWSQHSHGALSYRQMLRPLHSGRMSPETHPLLVATLWSTHLRPPTWLFGCHYYCCGIVYGHLASRVSWASHHYPATFNFLKLRSSPLGKVARNSICSICDLTQGLYPQWIATLAFIMCIGSLGLPLYSYYLLPAHFLDFDSSNVFL